MPRPIDESKIGGCLGTGESQTDYLLTGGDVDWLPELQKQDEKIYEYNQSWTQDCTLYSAFWAISDLFNYQFMQKEIDAMVEESYQRGRIKGEWRYVKDAVNLVADFWNKYHSDLWKVAYYRVSLYDTNTVDKILSKNYTLCSWYQGNSKYNADYREDCILNGTTFWIATYWHAVSWIARGGERYIKDNYKGRKNWKLPTNIYKVEHTPAELVSGQCFFSNAYLYVKVGNLEEIKRLNEFKTTLLVAIEKNSELRHLTNDADYKKKLHDANELHRKKLETVEERLKRLQ